MNKAIAAAVLVGAALVTDMGNSYASSVEVTKQQFAQVRPKTHQHAGWTRQRVQRVFETTGHRESMWYGENGRRHLVKTYPGTNGATITIKYAGAQTSTSGDFSGPMRTVEKIWDK